MRTILIANRKGGIGKTMVSITLAAALAGRGVTVALADADPQKSALRWLKHRPAGAAAVTGLDWTRAGHVGDVPGHYGVLIIDAPGAIRGGRAQALIAAADAVVAPVLPSWFDEDSTRRFLKDIEDIKRVRKGKVGLHLVANRVRAQARATDRLRGFFAALGHEPVAWIGERAPYGELAEQGLTIFDRPQRPFAPLRAQWEPLIATLA